MAATDRKAEQATAGATTPLWGSQTFASIDHMAATVRTLRPERRWHAAQLSRGPGYGRVATLKAQSATVTATELHGTVEVRGVVSDDAVVLGIGVAAPRGFRQWRLPASPGMALLIVPGADHDGVFFDRSRYLSMDVSPATLFAEADHEGYALHRRLLDYSHILPGMLDGRWFSWISAVFCDMIDGREPELVPGCRLEGILLAGLARHLGKESGVAFSSSELHHARIVELARDYIDANLAHPIHIDNLARASMAARATLYRAFRACLDESPQSYVLKLRLNRIRQALADPTEAARTVATVSNRWGISELGRLAASYREQFDEQTC